MRLLQMFLPVVFLLFISSCYQEKDDMLIPQDETTSVSENNYSGSASQRAGQTKSGKLEHHMQWASFIAGKVLRNHVEAQDEILMLLEDETIAIPLEFLLNGQTFIAQKFDIEFKNYLTLYVIQIEQLGKPVSSFDIPPAQGYEEDYLASLVDDFLDYLIVENCIELSFPKGLKFSEEFTITSTAHPLNNDQKNEGYIRYYEPIYTDNNVLTSAEEVIASPTYTAENENIIIARPFRHSSFPETNQSCLYEEYSEIAFKKFLEL